MAELMQEYWLLVLIALVIGVVVAWWIFHASRRTTIARDENVEPQTGARRNQALIDSPAAAKSDLDETAARNLAEEEDEPEVLVTDASPGPVSAAANTDGIAAAGADADAEAGAAVPAREAMKAVPAEPATTPTDGEELARIKGVGPKLVKMLHDMGVTSLSQIAAWEDEDIDRIDPQLGRFQGRIRRDNWVEQARLLDADDTAGYEERFGRLS